MSKPTVFVSGATGFIAQHIIKQLLDSGKYRVIGSVRKSAKSDQLKDNFNNKDLSFVYVENLAKEDAFDQAFQEHGPEIDYILHTASPVIMNPKDRYQDVILPAINGTKGIFEAAAKYAPNLKKFVMTSSHSAVTIPSEDFVSTNVFNEQSWNLKPLEEALKDPLDSYCYSKSAAEKSVWELQKKLDVKFTVSAVHPVFSFGPQCFDSSVTKTLNASCENINAATHSKLGDPVPETCGAFIDVRDVARAHVECLTNENLAGKRLILSEGRFTMQTIHDILNKEFPELDGKIAKGVPGSDKKVIDSFALLDNHVTKELLGFKFRELAESVRDTASQIFKVEESHK